MINAYQAKTNAKLHYIWSKFYKYNEILFPMR